MRIKTVLCLGTYLFFAACNKSMVKQKSSMYLFPDQVKNVTIMSQNSSYGPCEPSICISPINKDVIIAGTVLDNVHYSNDGGHTWSNKQLKSPHGVYGDPVTIIDKKGKILYAHLSNPGLTANDWLDRIVVQSSDDGVNFTDGSSPKGDRVKDQDKHWLAVNPIDNTILMSWTEFDKYGSKNDGDKSRILFSKSTDQGKTWSDALAISAYEGDCIDDDKTTEGAVPVVGIDGTYYIVWSYNEKIYLDRSMDKGKTWQANDQAIADQPGGWSFDIPGISRCNGMPVIRVDHSKGKHHGNIYVSWADQRNGTYDTDVWLITSTDKGKTWSSPKRVNDDDKGHQQFFSWMDIDQSNGYLHWVFYDRRAYEDDNTDVYIAYSLDGGQHITNQKISTNPFKPNKEVFFGDYNDISAVNGRIRPIWTRLDNGRLSVWTAILDVK
jgi:hypothetical protein